MADENTKVGFNFMFSVSGADKLQGMVRAEKLFSDLFAAMDRAARASGENKDANKLNKNLKESSVSAWTMAKGMIVAQAILGSLKAIGRDFLSTLLTQMPMIGQAFEAIKTVIMRNLVWPIAQAVLPVLLDMLKWVRENRIGFSQIGTVIASAFKLGISLIKSFMRAVGAFFSALGVQVKGSQDAFGQFTQFLNFLLLKIAFVFTFISIMIEPLMGKLGGLVRIVGGYVSDFITGFMEGMGSLFPLLNEMIGAISDLIYLFGLADRKGSSWLRAFGFSLAKSLLAPFVVLTKALRVLVMAISAVQKAIQFVVSMFNRLLVAIEPINRAFSKLTIGGQALDYIGDKISWLIGWIKKGASAALTFLDPFNMIKGTIDLIIKGLTWVIDKLKTIEMPTWLKDLGAKGAKLLGFDMGAPQPAITPGAGNQAGNVNRVNNVSQENNIVVNGAQSPGATANAISRSQNSNINWAQQMIQAGQN